jgi:hypothetical protein
MKARLEVYLVENGQDKRVGVHELLNGWPDVKAILDGGTHHLLCWRDALARNFLDESKKFIGAHPETFFGHWTDGQRSLYCQVVSEHCDGQRGLMVLNRSRETTVMV